MKKRIIVTVLSIAMAALMLAAFGCSGNKGEQGDKPTAEPAAEAKTAEQVYQDVLAVSGFGNMTAVNKRDYIEIYGIDTNNFDDYVWYQSENPSLNADEVAIFLVKEEKAERYVSVLESLLHKHLNTRINVAESYSPEEAGKLKQAEVTTVKGAAGTWVYVCVGNEYSSMMDVFAADLGR